MELTPLTTPDVITFIHKVHNCLLRPDLTISYLLTPGKLPEDPYDISQANDIETITNCFLYAFCMENGNLELGGSPYACLWKMNTIIDLNNSDGIYLAIDMDCLNLSDHLKHDIQNLIHKSYWNNDIPTQISNGHGRQYKLHYTPLNDDWNNAESNQYFYDHNKLYDVQQHHLQHINGDKLGKLITLTGNEYIFHTHQLQNYRIICGVMGTGCNNDGGCIIGIYHWTLTRNSRDNHEDEDEDDYTNKRPHTQSQ